MTFSISRNCSQKDWILPSGNGFFSISTVFIEDFPKSINAIRDNILHGTSHIIRGVGSMNMEIVKVMGNAAS